MLPAIMALAQFAPSIIGLLSKDKTANTAADMVSQVARSLTGAGTDTEALAALGDNPELQIEYRAQMNAHAVEMYAEETKRVEMVNETMRVEYSNQDGFVRRMRPTFGYVGAYCVALMFTTVTVVTAWSGIDSAVKLIKAYAQMEWILLGVFGVIGVYVVSRSKDKKPPVAGLLGAIASRIGR